jgi:hypothetical protein
MRLSSVEKPFTLSHYLDRVFGSRTIASINRDIRWSLVRDICETAIRLMRLAEHQLKLARDIPLPVEDIKITADEGAQSHSLTMSFTRAGGNEIRFVREGEEAPGTEWIAMMSACDDKVPY